MQDYKTLNILRWIARISGGAIVIFVGYFVIAHIFGDDESGEGFRSAAEVLMFVCFPISTLTGLTLAYWKEGIGGLITIVGLVGLLVLNPGTAGMVMFPAVPAVLYLVYWSQTRDRL